MKAKTTERGWAGHFICANRCRFRRNTLVEYGDIKIVVSTVGLMEDWKGDKYNTEKFETIGFERYYETMCFYANQDDTKYYDANVSREVSFDSEWAIGEIDKEVEANVMHDTVVREICSKLKSGDL